MSCMAAIALSGTGCAALAVGAAGGAMGYKLWDESYSHRRKLNQIKKELMKNNA